jgi:flagellar hook-length control protein FliK
MRLTEAISSDTPVLASGNAAPQRVWDSATSQFASVLRATRRSSNRLMDLLKVQSQVRRDLAEQQERRPETRSREQVDQSQEKANRNEQTEEPRRSEQLRSKARDGKTAVKEAVEPVDQEVERIDGENEESVACPRAPERPDSPPETSTVNAVTVPTGLSEGRRTAAVEMPAQGQTAAPVIPAGPAVTEPPIRGGTATAEPGVAAQGREAESTFQAIKPVSPTGATGGTDTMSPGKSAEAAMRAATSVRAGSAGAEGDFKSLMQHLGRTRFGESMASAAVFPKTKPAAGSTEKPVDLQSAESVRELARLVRSRIGPRQSSMTMTMSPAELGRLRIDVRMEDAALTVRFQAETAVGHEAIKGKLDELRGALEQQGIQIDRIEVEYLPPAPAVGSDRDGQGQQSDGRQWQMPAEYGGSAGHAGESFDRPQQESEDPSAGGIEPGAGEPVLEAEASWNWLSSGVDLVA